MKSETIKAEILLAAYNGEAYIRAQIDSILAQSDHRWHLTVSDDGSSDGTSRIIDEYVRAYPQQISRYHAPRRFGNARDHFFHLMQQCSAEYMFFCDQDDVWYPDKVKKTLNAMLDAQLRLGGAVPVLVFSDQTPTDAQLKPLAPSLMRYQNQYFGEFDYRSLLMQNVVTGGAMCINRALAQLAAQCADPANTIMHDWWLAVVAARFGTIVYLDESLSDYRQHGTNSVGAKDVRSAAHVVRKLARLGQVRETAMNKKRQAQVLYDTYHAQLGAQDETFLTAFVRPHSGPAFYWKHRGLIHGFFRLAGMMVLG